MCTLIQTHTITHARTHRCSYTTNEQAAFSLGISLPICFFPLYVPLTHSLYHHQAPSSHISMTACPELKHLICFTCTFQTQTCKHTQQCMQSEKKSFIFFVFNSKTSRHKYEIVMKCTLCCSNTHMPVIEMWLGPI